MVALKLIGITVVLLGLGVAGIAIKIWAKKDGEFAGTCASQSPFLNQDGETCSYCGKNPNQCENNLEQAKLGSNADHPSVFCTSNSPFTLPTIK